MARKKTSGKTIAVIAVAVVLILGLLVALAYSPPGQTLIEKYMGKLDEGGNGNNGGNTQILPVYTAIGGDITIGTEVVLDNIVFKAHFIDVGQGDAILLEFGDGKTVMIDAGSTSPGLADCRTETLAYLGNAGVDKIEYVIVTHPDTDHYNMLEAVMDAYVVDNVIYNACEKNKTYTGFIERIVEETGNASMIIDADGEDYSITGTGYTVNVYAPGYGTFENGDGKYDAEESNGMSPMIVVETAGRRLLFTGDGTVETESWFIEKMGGDSYDVDFLKAGHHGSDTSTSQALLDFITPEYCVIMCDNGEEYSHPDTEVMNRLFDMGVVTYRTNRHGNIVLNIDEDGDMAFAVEREVPAENNKNGINDLMLVSAPAA